MDADSILYEPVSKHVFCLPNKFSILETVKTEFGAKTMGLDSKTHNLLVDTSDFDTPAPTAQQPNPQPRAKPGTFRLLIYGR